MLHPVRFSFLRIIKEAYHATISDIVNQEPLLLHRWDGGAVWVQRHQGGNVDIRFHDLSIERAAEILSAVRAMDRLKARAGAAKKKKRKVKKVVLYKGRKSR